MTVREQPHDRKPFSPAVVTVDEAGVILSYGPAAERLFGYTASDALGRSFDMVVDLPQGNRLAQLLSQCGQAGTGEPAELACRGQGRCKDGTAVALALVLHAVGGRRLFVVVAGEAPEQGIAEGEPGRWAADEAPEHGAAEEARVGLELARLRSQKLEAIGVLAGGIVHNFNNLLGAIIGNTELALGNTGNEARLRTNLERILQGADRAKQLVKRILGFGRGKEGGPGPVEIATCVEDALELISACLPAMIEIRRVIDRKAGAVVADPVEIQQVVINLCTNAYDAMGEEGGVLSVELNAVEVDAALAGRQAALSEGAYVKLRVSDTGCGMDEATKKRIFEPFFTTKAAGEGTGLGLSMVRKTVLDHGGAIAFESSVGKGTTFDIYLPRSKEPLSKSRSGEKSLSLGGSERVLLVEDEDLLIDAAQEMLERLGYRVTALAGSEEALVVFRARPYSFDLAVANQGMPALSGVSLAMQLKRIRPDLPVVITTGYSRSVDAEAVRAMGLSGYLGKPYAAGELGTAVRKALNERARLGPQGGSSRHVETATTRATPPAGLSH